MICKFLILATYHRDILNVLQQGCTLRIHGYFRNQDGSANKELWKQWLRCLASLSVMRVSLPSSQDRIRLGVWLFSLYPAFHPLLRVGASLRCWTSLSCFAPSLPYRGRVADIQSVCVTSPFAARAVVVGF